MGVFTNQERNKMIYFEIAVFSCIMAGLVMCFRNNKPDGGYTDSRGFPITLEEFKNEAIKDAEEIIR